jgi:hypothetical protein
MMPTKTEQDGRSTWDQWQVVPGDGSLRPGSERADCGRDLGRLVEMGLP